AERRIEQAMRFRGLDRDTAERTLHALDRTHAGYLRQFYDVDILDPGLYHVMLDATSLDAEVCIDIIAMAAEALNLSES
ncbi:MAG: cytidylate kinase family protein, partial [Solirubrobacteraceae bacterium]